LVLFHVIPAKAGIQCFHPVTNTLDPGFHRGDEYSAIFSHLPFNKGGLPVISIPGRDKSYWRWQDQRDR